MTPYEAWSNQKPNVSRLKVFESVAYSLIDPSDHSKLDKKKQKLHMCKV